MNKKVRAALSEALNELRRLPQAEFRALVDAHSDGEIAQLLKYAEAFPGREIEAKALDLSEAISSQPNYVVVGVETSAMSVTFSTNTSALDQIRASAPYTPKNAASILMKDLEAVVVVNPDDKKLAA